MSKVRLFGVLILFAILFSAASSSYAAPVQMNNYCITPPFVSTTINPNVLVLVANSPSTGRRAYQNPLTGNNTAAYDDTKTYFGYFDSNSWYTYSGGTFIFAGTGIRPNTNTYKGNFMNWIAMRRMDLITTVLIGGRANSRNFSKQDLPTEVHGVCAEGDYLSTSDVTTAAGKATRTMTGATACSYVDNSLSLGGTNICSASAVQLDLTKGNSCTPAKASILQITQVTALDGTGVASCNNCNTTLDVDVTYNQTNGDPQNSGVILDNLGQVRWGMEVLNPLAGGFIPNSVAIVGPPCGGQNWFTACGGGSPGVDCGAIDVNDTGGNPIGEAVWTGIGYFSQGLNPNSSSDLGNGSGGITKGVNGPDYGGQPGDCNGSSCIKPNYDPLNYDDDVDNSTDPASCAKNTGKGFPPCAKNFILLLTDGEPTSDISLPTNVANINNTWADSIGSGSVSCTTTGTVATGNSDCAIDNVTLYGMSTGSAARDVRGDLSGNQQVATFIVQANFDNTGASTNLEVAARNGAFDDKNGNGVPDLTTEWDEDGDGVPDNFFHASDGNELRAQLDAAIRAILRRATSGTAASIIGAGKGSGANLLQAFFFPKKDFVSGSSIATLSWIGFLQNFWFEVDPLLQFTNIREDTDTDVSLAQAHDDIDVFTFDSVQGKTLINRYLDQSPADGFADVDGSNNLISDTPAQVEINQVRSLWEAGVNLFTRDTDGHTRDIRTSLLTQANPPQTLIQFDTANCGSLQPFMQATAGTCSAGQEAYNLIKYVRGTDFTGFRSRTATLDIPPYAPTTTATSTWKLGDVIDSTAKIQGAFALNDYDKRYGDATYNAYVNDKANTASATYHDNGYSMIYSGANDGMWHAYYMGQLSTAGVTPPEIVSLTDPLSLGLGKELFTYVPKNALPYLRYLSDPNYCHLYYVDLPSKLVDAAVDLPTVSSATYPGETRTRDMWRTIAIGGMGYGGGCGCTASSTGGQPDCIQSVKDSSNNNIGLSSFFAFDVTDPQNAQLLWEFSASDMGLAFTSPAIVRIGDAIHNGKWYVVIGSGPTGGVNTAAHQFVGHSNQHAKVFILDLKDGKQVTGSPIDLNTQIGSRGLDFAWVGAVSDPFDTDANQMDEIIYLSITKKDAATNLWNKGTIVRLLTHESTDVSTWTAKELLNADIGPVTAKLSGLTANQRQQLWLYFGSGRYYYKFANASDDSAASNALTTDVTHTRTIYGVKDPCFSAATAKIDDACNTKVNVSALTNSTQTAPANPPVDGWFINLCSQAQVATNGAAANCTGAAAPVSTDLEERMISDTQTSPLGVVFFTTFAPSNDPCTFGGKTFIYALKFDTGSSGAGYLFGSAIVQTSTGAIQQINLTNAFNQRASSNESLGRRSAFFFGQAPVESPLIVLTPPPVQRILRLKEK